MIAILMFNMVAPAFASISSSDGKSLICTQNGFEWVSNTQQQQQYLSLAQALNLDIETLFPELNDTAGDHYAGKCHFCYFDEKPLFIGSSEQLLDPSLFVVVKPLIENPVVVTLGKFQQPPSRAPPVQFSL